MIVRLGVYAQTTELAFKHQRQLRLEQIIRTCISVGDMLRRRAIVTHLPLSTPILGQTPMMQLCDAGRHVRLHTIIVSMGCVLK